MRARTLAQELVATVIAMYGDGLARIMEVIGDSREAGATILDQLSQDGAVASLLLIHDLYPVSLEERVLEALDTVRPYMESHGGNVELIGLEDGVAKLVLQGSCNGCAASRATLELAIKQALDEHAPDLAGTRGPGRDRAAGADAGPPAGGSALPMAAPAAAPTFELPIVHAGPELPARRRAGAAVGAGRRVGAPRGRARCGRSASTASALLLADVDGSLLGYAERVRRVRASRSATAALEGGMLRCPACEVEFDLPRAGRAAGGEPLQLRPVPLLEAGGLRVAV